jgi:hypothetical protein
MVGFVADLPMAEAEWHQTSGDMRPVATIVRRLLGRRPVIAKAVGLDDEAQVGPVEIDAIVV